MSAKSKDNTGFKPAPHANAKVHAELMKKLKKMTAEEILKTSVKAGIHTPSGKLRKQYA